MAGSDRDCTVGRASVGARLREAVEARGSAGTVLAVECYSGVLDAEVAPALRAGGLGGHAAQSASLSSPASTGTSSKRLLDQPSRPDPRRSQTA